MTLDEKVDWFCRHGVINIPYAEFDDFAVKVADLGVAYHAVWDNGLKVYYVEKING